MFIRLSKKTPRSINAADCCLQTSGVAEINPIYTDSWVLQAETGRNSFCCMIRSVSWFESGTPWYDGHFFTPKKSRNVGRSSHKLSANIRQRKTSISYSTAQWSENNFSICVHFVIEIGIALISFANWAVIKITNVLSLIICGSKTSISIEVQSRNLYAGNICRSLLHFRVLRYLA